MSLPGFATTRWTLVLAAARSGENESRADSGRALAELCATYRPPVLAHALRGGLAPADAEDAVQGVFQNLLRLGSLASLRPRELRFRAWLLASFNHHLSDLRDHARAAKRGADRTVQLDSAGWGVIDAADSAPAPDEAFDRAWALALLETTLARLRDEQAAAGRGEWFEALVPCLAGRVADVPQAGVAAQLGLSEPALRVAIHRLRKRYRELLREEVAQTVASSGEIDDELRHLMAVVAGR